MPIMEHSIAQDIDNASKEAAIEENGVQVLKKLWKDDPHEVSGRNQFSLSAPLRRSEGASAFSLALTERYARDFAKYSCEEALDGGDQ